MLVYLIGQFVYLEKEDIPRESMFTVLEAFIRHPADGLHLHLRSVCLGSSPSPEHERACLPWLSNFNFATNLMTCFYSLILINKKKIALSYKHKATEVLNAVWPAPPACLWFREAFLSVVCVQCNWKMCASYWSESIHDGVKSRACGSGPDYSSQSFFSPSLKGD